MSKEKDNRYYFLQGARWGILRGIQDHVPEVDLDWADQELQPYIEVEE